MTASVAAAEPVPDPLRGIQTPVPAAGARRAGSIDVPHGTDEATSPGVDHSSLEGAPKGFGVLGGELELEVDGQLHGSSIQYKTQTEAALPPRPEDRGLRAEI